MSRAKVGIGIALGVAGVLAVACAGVFAIGLAGIGVATWTVSTQSEQALRATLSAATAGEITFESLSVGLGTVTVEGVEVHRGADRLVRVDEVVLHVGISALTASSWRIGRVDVDGVHADLTLAETGWLLPEATTTLVQAGSTAVTLPEVAIDEVRVSGVDARATSADGTLTVTAGSAVVRGVSASMAGGLALKVTDAEVEEVDVSSTEPIARIANATLGADGVARVGPTSVHAEIGAGGRPKLPPIVVDYAPSWMGGRWALDASKPWLGIDLGWLPWKPVRAEVGQVEVDVVDGALVAPPVRWKATVRGATAGPLSQAADSVPFTADVAVASGDVRAEGALNIDGRVDTSLVLANGDATAFVPYIQDSLDHYGLTVRKGTVNADVKATLVAPRLAMTGKVTASDLVFARAEGKNGALAVAANAGVGLLGRERSYTVPVRVEGSLDDPGFRPVASVVHGFEDQIFGAIGGTVTDAGSAVVGGAKQAGEAVKGKLKGLGRKNQD